MTPGPFRVGVTRDLLPWDADGRASDIGLDLLDAPRDVEWRFLAEDPDELSPELIEGFDALFVERPAVRSTAIVDNDRLALIARFGVGYDKIDLEACTASGVAVTIARDGVRRPVAVSALTLLLSASQNMLQLDALTREGRWHDRESYMGVGLVGRTVGAIGLGNIGRELFRLLAPFDVKLVAHDPYVAPSVAEPLGAELLDFRTVCEVSDFLVVLCPLSPETHHLVGARALSWMKPSAFLINVARGPIVDQRALTEALSTSSIRGAGLDVLEPEPVDPSDPILGLENVILTPHYLCYTDQCLRDCGRAASESILSLAAGRIPGSVVNPEALRRGRWPELTNGSGPH